MRVEALDRHAGVVSDVEAEIKERSNVEKVSATFKIGNNKGRPRIWLDGKRLTEAGFVGGTVYECGVQAELEAVEGLGRIQGMIECAIKAVNKSSVYTRITNRKVTGRANGKPIIDMLGADVEAAFPGAERVSVVFEQGRITITRA